jgi:hypothetical protein
MNENEVRQHLLSSAREDLEFYSNAGKEVRERWVVSEFLKAIECSFEKSEISSLEQSSKIDVQFRDARFQVKEIVSPKLLRGKRVKDTYNSIKSAKILEDIELPSIAEDIPNVAKIYDLVLAEANKLSTSEIYKTSKNELDLIFYITRTRASLIQKEEINTHDFSCLGWRSVICLNSKQAVILYAASRAPKFLREGSERVAIIGSKPGNGSEF